MNPKHNLKLCGTREQQDVWMTADAVWQSLW